MNTNIIAIGTSKGIIIPSGALKQLNLSLRSSVEITVVDDSIVIKSVSENMLRAGWEQDAKLAAQSFDELADTGTMNENSLKWQTWE
jgi:antitoxin component of MazEF toxin-antitoxin module